MTETPQQSQDDDPRPAASSPEREGDQSGTPENPPEPAESLPEPAGSLPGPAESLSAPAGSLPQPPPYRGVYGQPPGAPPSAHGQPPQGRPPYGQPPYGQAPQAPQGQQVLRYGVQPYDPAYGAYDPRWGYGPPGNPEHPEYGQPTGDDTTMALFCYVGALLGGFLVPLILYLIKKNESRFVRFHAAQALNYTLTQMIVFFSVLAPLGIVAIVTRQPAILVLAAPVWLYEAVSPYVWMILGAIRSNRGEWYTMPKWTCFRMVR
ncbi:MAG: uncharacterized protein QOE54_1481 [Streptosporangiaceae bacterium]|nr:uncharacterized protein [Streptosporangiaceae bacterium]